MRLLHKDLDEVSCVALWEKRVPGRRNNKCKGPEAETWSNRRRPVGLAWMQEGQERSLQRQQRLKVRGL